MGIFRRQKHLSEEEISAYVDNALTSRQRQAVDSHLRSCQTCAQKVAATRAMKALLTSLPAPSLPRAFTLTQSDLASRRSSAGGGWLRPLWNAATVVVALLLVLLVGRDFLPLSGPSFSMAPAAPVAKQAEVIATTTLSVPTAPVAAVAAENRPTPLLRQAQSSGVQAKGIAVETPVVTLQPKSQASDQARAFASAKEKAPLPVPAGARQGSFLSELWAKVTLVLMLALLLVSRPLLPR